MHLNLDVFLDIQLGKEEDASTEPTGEPAGKEVFVAKCNSYEAISDLVGVSTTALGLRGE